MAAEIGEGLADALSWKNFRSALKQRIVGLYKSKSGSIVEKKGSTFLKRLYAQGFWAAEEYPYEQWSRVLATESGRFEFLPASLWQALAEQAAEHGQQIDTFAQEAFGAERPESLCLPAYRELEANSGSDSLLLLPYKPHTYARGSGANLPWLVELTDWHGRASWVTEAELHPRTAAQHDIQTGDDVILESSAGRIGARAYLTAGVREGLVRVAQGAGHTAFGRFAAGWGANVMQLISLEAVGPFGGSSALQGTHVRIAKGKLS